MSGKDSSPVLCDVVVQGRRALARPQVSISAAGSTVPSESDDRPAAAQNDDEAIRRGYAEGFAKGLAQGTEEAKQMARQTAEQAERDRLMQNERLVHELKQEAQATFEARISQMSKLIAALPPQIDARVQAAEDDILALCFEVICRMLGDHAFRPEVLRAHLKQATDAMRNRQLVAIHLHPDDLAVLEKTGAAPANGGERDGVQWNASNEVALGGCILQSPEGGLDARFETQLRTLRELLHHGRAAARASAPAEIGAGS